MFSRISPLCVSSTSSSTALIFFVLVICPHSTDRSTSRNSRSSRSHSFQFLQCTLGTGCTQFTEAPFNVFLAYKFARLLSVIRAHCSRMKVSVSLPVSCSSWDFVASGKATKDRLKFLFSLSQKTNWQSTATLKFSRRIWEIAFEVNNYVFSWQFFLHHLHLLGTESHLKFQIYGIIWYIKEGWSFLFHMSHRKIEAKFNLAVLWQTQYVFLDFLLEDSFIFSD